MKKIIMLFVVAASIFLLASCGKKTYGKNTFSGFSEHILDILTESYEDGDISPENIVIDQIYCGHFSRPDVNEIFILCKILNMPHVAGLDKTIALLLDADSLEKAAYKEFGADNVTIDCIQTSAGQSRILFIGTTIYQGILTQEIQLWGIRDGQWLEIPIEGLESLSGGHFCFMGDEEIIISSLTDHADISAIFSWNPDTGEFLPE